MKCTKEYRMGFDGKAAQLVSQMTLEEKIHMMAGHSKPSASMGGGGYNLEPYPFGGCRRLGVPELHFCDGPRGCVSGSSTCFPVPMARGASFDPELERENGRVIGKEVLGNGGDYFGGVCMNIPYHPGAGRSQECYGEDSYHMGEMASALMEGVQEQNVIACAKHFAFNSMERSRFKVNVTADERTEKEVYLPHFRKVVERGAASVMNAYNLYKGAKCGHNSYLLREVLKENWGFDGFVISDFAFGVSSAGGGISGGCDVEMHLRLTYMQAQTIGSWKGLFCYQWDDRGALFESDLAGHPQPLGISGCGPIPALRKLPTMPILTRSVKVSPMPLFARRNVFGVVALLHLRSFFFQFPDKY